LKNTLTIDVIIQNEKHNKIDCKNDKIEEVKVLRNIPKNISKVIHGRKGNVSDNIGEERKKSENKSEKESEKECEYGNNIENHSENKKDDRSELKNEKIIEKVMINDGTSSTSFSTSTTTSTFSVSHLTPSIGTTFNATLEQQHTHAHSTVHNPTHKITQKHTETHTETRSDNFPGIEVLYGRRRELFESDCEGELEGGKCDGEGVVGEMEGMEGGEGEGEGEEGEGVVGGGEGMKGRGGGEGEGREYYDRINDDTYTDINSGRKKETGEEQQKENEKADEEQERKQAEREQENRKLGGLMTGDTIDMDEQSDKEIEGWRETLSPDSGIEESSIEDVDIIEDFFDLNTAVKGSVGKRTDELSSFFVSTFSPSNSAYHMEK
jgi:hypothetical protein